jgi:hypothetical protein
MRLTSARTLGQHKIVPTTLKRHLIEILRAKAFAILPHLTREPAVVLHH